MNILKTINIVRRNLMQGMTKKISGSAKNQNLQMINKNAIKTMLICRPNHRLGNQLLITPLVQEVTEIFPNCKIDLFVKGNIAPIIFENYKNIDSIIRLPKKHFDDLLPYMKGWIALQKKEYDLVINVEKNSSSGRLSTKFAKSNYKFFGDEETDFELKYPHHKHIAKYPVYSLRSYLSKLGIPDTENPVPPLDIKLSLPEIAAAKLELEKLINKDKKTICLFTFATGEKCYSETWWNAFYARLKEEYSSNYNIVELLPVENVSQIGFKAPSFYSKDIRQIASFIANTDIFIGADSGMMHLASASKTPTVGLFSVTSIEKYEPYGNNSVAVDTNTMTTDQMIITIDAILSKS
jgi:heptosyltransferase-3